ncbi:hypothetical protein C8R43DRAFT_1124008 [Mycena crocata]|nr:hypothetical protein C8R43DRAFT_1124008 [Mycena crocata]
MAHISFSQSDKPGIRKCVNHLVLHGRIAATDVDSMSRYFEKAGGEIERLEVGLRLPQADLVALMGQIFPHTTTLRYISFFCFGASTSLDILRLLPSTGLHFIKITFGTRDNEVHWREFDALNPNSAP